jgi:membrane-associated protease RseP (regulator of RpoE activity)
LPVAHDSRPNRWAQNGFVRGSVCRVNGGSVDNGFEKPLEVREARPGSRQMGIERRAAKKSILLASAIVWLFGGSLPAEERPALGIVMSEQYAGRSGVAVTAVIPGSPAARARLRAGDRITALNGQPVADYRDILRIVASSAPGAELNVDFYRGPFLMTRAACLGPHQQVFPGRPVYQVAVPGSPWLHPFAPRAPNPQRNELMNSLYNSDF